MYKFLFELLTDPLSLPINPIWEYIILSIIGVIAFKIAWNESPGGPLGSLIHWTIRFVVFVSLWFVIDTIIVVGQWLIKNWFIAVFAVGGIGVVFVVSIVVKMIFKKKQTKAKFPQE